VRVRGLGGADVQGHQLFGVFHCQRGELRRLLDVGFADFSELFRSVVHDISFSGVE
jgi:hypothetical protein